jgi:hypothetical protein
MRTAIYVRVSTNCQTQAQTIEQQVERLQRHLESQGEPRLTENIFRDDGYSGANLNRPGLDRLHDRVKNGTLDRVVITSPDRLARNYVHQMVLVEEWERCSCKVEFLDHPMSQDPHDHLRKDYFDQVIQILAGSDLHSLWKFAIFLHLPHRPMRCCIGVQCDFAGLRVFFIALRRKLLAAFTSRFWLRKKSTVRPALSTAR